MIQGKGIFIWKIRWCEGGNAERIAQAAVDAGLQHVLIKIADGTGRFNIHPLLFYDLVPPVVKALRERGISVWGWHYVYGKDPAGEARMAGKRVRDLGLDGYVIDAEAEWKAPGMRQAAITYLRELRRDLPTGMPIALSSFRFPQLHQAFPWLTFLPAVDLIMPQVYWEKATNPGEQLQRCVREYRALSNLPIIPTGAAYHEHGWTAKPVEIVEFYQVAKALNLNTFNFWEWNQARTYDLWGTVAGLEKHADQPVLTKARSISYGLRIRKAPSTNAPIVGGLFYGETVLVHEMANTEEYTWCRHDRGWSCVQQAGKAAYMELINP